jgi:ssDNA-binding Zn-finger/Zn-ribbon topoisomerase 1
VCGKLMALRTARQGKRAGSQFWGCTAYPACKGSRPLEGGDDRTGRTDRSDRTDEERGEP